MHTENARSRPRRRRLVSLLAAAALAVVPLAAVQQSGASAAGLRNFDAVTTVNERNVWKHMALIGDQYVIYNDVGIIEGPASIRQKWPFLPEHFTHDIDAAGVGFSGPGFRWRHTWTKGTQAIVFEDNGIVTGPLSIPSAYDGISDYNNSPGETSRIFHDAVRGGKSVSFFDQNFAAPNFDLSRLTYLPERFTHDLDDISVEIENTRKTSYYKGNERLIVNDRGQIVELVNLDIKWPFLNGWRASG